MIIKSQYDIDDRVVVCTHHGKIYGKISSIYISRNTRQDHCGANYIKYRIQTEGRSWISAPEYRVSKVGTDIISELQSSG